MGIFSRLRGSGGYISAKKTVAAAAAAELSVSDYVERLWGLEGQTDAIVDRIRAAGGGGGTIVEIGAGTGRYLCRLVDGAVRYESYETARDWASWLGKTYRVESMKADGRTLSGTPDCSADLVHANGVFVYTPFFVSLSYWQEMGRVLRPGGIAAFDVFSHDCMGEAEIAGWRADGADYPVVMDVAFVRGFFPGFSEVDSFTVKNGPGKSRYLILRKN